VGAPDEADRGERDDQLTSKETEELKRLRRENAELKRTNEILRLASAFSPRRPTRPAQVVTFVESHRHTFGVAPLLAAIGEPGSTFYDRISRAPSARAVADAAVVERIKAIWEGRAAASARHASTPCWPARASGWVANARATDAPGGHSVRSPAQTLENHPTEPRCGRSRPGQP
jgi:hypothetical protein